MELKRYGPNVAEITTADGARVLFSYSEPVAAYVPGLRLDFAWIKTAQFFSRTTSGHVSKWLRDNGAPAHVPAVPHAELLKITKGVR